MFLTHPLDTKTGLYYEHSRVYHWSEGRLLSMGPVTCGGEHK